ncbi:MAG: L-threonylcarbamoyladenylate synthase, partial [Pseudomonadota bacterium]
MTARILPPSPDSIALAADALKRGGLVAMPTETVYGLAADATSDSAVAALYEAKGRPRFNPLIAHVASLEAAAMQAVLSDEALVLAAAFWPGPLTLVLPVSESCTVCDLARAGLDTIAIRMPAHPVARALLKAFGGPLVAPSANPSGRVSPTTAAHVAADMGEQVEAILDGGPCDLGLEST